MKSSKKRKIAGVAVRSVTLALRAEVYEKLCQIAGPESLAATVEKMAEHYHDRALRRQSQQIAK